MQNHLNHLILIFAAAGACLVLAACQSDANRSKILAEAFAGPLSLPLREEIAPSKTVATAKHGDKLGVVAMRRRFVKVRTSAGVEGWTEARHLMTADDLKKIEDLARRSASLPSQGLATVYEPLNVHSEPQREATSFEQITEGVKVEV
ncbi:MAG: SH3 domain-containing protein, partial [Bryobacteraceae bacterium]